MVVGGSAPVQGAGEVVGGGEGKQTSARFILFSLFDSISQLTKPDVLKRVCLVRFDAQLQVGLRVAERFLCATEEHEKRLKGMDDGGGSTACHVCVVGAGGGGGKMFIALLTKNAPAAATHTAPHGVDGGEMGKKKGETGACGCGEARTWIPLLVCNLQRVVLRGSTRDSHHCAGK